MDLQKKSEKGRDLNTRPLEQLAEAMLLEPFKGSWQDLMNSTLFFRGISRTASW